MSRPVIGIPMHTNVNNPERKSLAFMGGPNYTRALDLNGGSPFFVPLQVSEDALRAIYEKMDGLLLAGGEDVHPREYGEDVAPFCGEIDKMRDALELTLTRWALRDRKPILAICRGIQLLNVAAGGSLFQDIESQHPDPIAHRWNRAEQQDRWHPVVVEQGTRLAQALGATQLDVNSAHHQALKTIGENLRVIATSSDQIVEAVEGANGALVLGVQFHPERMLEREPRAHGIFG
ncbi:MAG: gamma-glutamyl-gamma-aminobutyrate hydrolase family protein, partial [Chloroflexi bacterium]|nr:gamma-glutamyl-gamma-aminobutyrate hydrolase family protein [Chloroflexota bacterium]